MSHHAKTITDFDAIIFDMDGLLLDTEKLSYESFVMTADAYDQKFQFDDYRQLIGRNAKTGIDILQKMLPATLDAAKFKDEWLNVYRQLLDDNIEVKPGAHQLLAYLEKMQKVLYLSARLVRILTTPTKPIYKKCLVMKLKKLMILRWRLHYL